MLLFSSTERFSTRNEKCCRMLWIFKMKIDQGLLSSVVMNLIKKSLILTEGLFNSANASAVFCMQHRQWCHLRRFRRRISWNSPRIFLLRKVMKVHFFFVPFGSAYWQLSNFFEIKNPFTQKSSQACQWNLINLCQHQTNQQSNISQRKLC